MGLNLANAGLAAQGANQATADYQTLRTGKIGLDALERSNTTDEDIRGVSAAGGTHDDFANAAERRGDFTRAEAHRRHAKALEDEGVRNVVQKALVDPTPGDRPDLVAEANRYGKSGIGMRSMTLDDQGNLTFSGAKSGTLNVGVAAERMGLVKPFEHVMPAGSTYVRSNPVTNKTTSFTAPNNGTKHGFELGTVSRNGTEYKVSFNKDTGEATLLDDAGNPTKAEAKVHTDPSGKTYVTVGREVFEVQPGQPGQPASSGFLGFGAKPEVPAKPSSLTPVNAGGDQPPVPGSRKAPDGQWYVEDPKNKGKFLQVVVGGGAAQPAAAPTAASAARPAAAPRPAAPAAAPAADEEKLPEVVSSPAAEPARMGRGLGLNRGRVEAARVEQEKATASAPKRRAAETFRAIASSPKMTADDAPLIQEAIDSGFLTPAEKSKAERMLAKLKPQTAAYKSGGKVQRHGL